MSLFASKVTKVVEIEGHGAFTIRKLNRKRMEKAAIATQANSIANVTALGGAAVIKEMRSMASADDLQAALAEAKKQVQAENAEVKESDSFAGYDRTTLIVEGVTAWPNEIEPSREEIEDLDQDVEEKLAREIYDLSRPSRKNG